MTEKSKRNKKRRQYWENRKSIQQERKYEMKLSQATMSFVISLIENWIPSDNEVLRSFGFGSNSVANKKLFNAYRQGYLDGKFDEFDLGMASGNSTMLNELLGLIEFPYKVVVLTDWRCRS